MICQCDTMVKKDNWEVLECDTMVMKDDWEAKGGLNIFFLTFHRKLQII